MQAGSNRLPVVYMQARSNRSMYTNVRHLSFRDLQVDKMMKTLMLLIVLVSLTITTARFLDESVSILPIISDLFPGVCVVVRRVAWSRAECARFSVQI